MDNAVGVLGGVGPLATVYFMDMIIEMTDASTDQEHINMLVSNHATIPDRTAYIMGESIDSPVKDMTDDAIILEKAGCDFIVIPCNTAHYFFEDVKGSVDIPVLNIIVETVRLAIGGDSSEGTKVKRLGIMATEGTVSSGTYSFYGKPLGVECVAPDKEYQEKVNSIIYDKVKAGNPVSYEEMMEVIDHLTDKGCDKVIMGCTELSVVYKDLNLSKRCPVVVDSLEALARTTILKCGKKIRERQ
jgi:aspartate racemase